MAGDTMRCPVCNSREVGKISSNQYYCWNCHVEFNGENKAFSISEDGNLAMVESGR